MIACDARWELHWLHGGCGFRQQLPRFPKCSIFFMPWVAYCTQVKTNFCPSPKKVAMRYISAPMHLYDLLYKMNAIIYGASKINFFTIGNWVVGIFKKQGDLSVMEVQKVSCAAKPGTGQLEFRWIIVAVFCTFLRFIEYNFVSNYVEFATYLVCFNFYVQHLPSSLIVIPIHSRFI